MTKGHLRISPIALAVHAALVEIARAWQAQQFWAAWAVKQAAMLRDK